MNYQPISDNNNFNYYYFCRQFLNYSFKEISILYFFSDMHKNIIVQLSFILLITYIGNFIASHLPFAFPGVVIGLILLFFALYFRLIKLSHIDKVTNVLLANMTFLFIPAGVALIDSLELLSMYWWKLLIVILVSTIVTMIVTGWVVQQSIYYFRKRNAIKR